jgi:DNA-binding HxlR family transcriptional regulator
MDIVGGKWKALILWALNERTHRFGELKRMLPGVSEKMLAQQLRELESDAIVHRDVFDEVPPRVEYSLTEVGVALNAALTPLSSRRGRRSLLRRRRRGPPCSSNRGPAPTGCRIWPKFSASALRRAGRQWRGVQRRSARDACLDDDARR